MDNSEGQARQEGPLDDSHPKALRASIENLPESIAHDGTKLSGRETYFLDLLFNDEDTKGNVSRALTKAGFTKTYLKKSLKEEIIRRAENLLSLNAPKAAMALVDALDHKEETTNKAAFKVAVAEKILDRVGLSKKQQVEMTGEVRHSVFILPAKQPVTIDVNATTVEPEA